jgi:hypothetical protein
MKVEAVLKADHVVPVPPSPHNFSNDTIKPSLRVEHPMVLRFVKRLGASNGATIEICLPRSVGHDGGVQVCFPFGILNHIGRRLVMKQPRNGLWSGRTACRTGCRELDLSLELCDLPGARPATRGSAEAERGRGDKDAHISTPPRLTRQTAPAESSAC